MHFFFQKIFFQIERFVLLCDQLFSLSTISVQFGDEIMLCVIVWSSWREKVLIDVICYCVVRCSHSANMCIGLGIKCMFLCGQLFSLWANFCAGLEMRCLTASPTEPKPCLRLKRLTVSMSASLACMFKSMVQIARCQIRGEWSLHFCELSAWLCELCVFRFSLIVMQIVGLVWSCSHLLSLEYGSRVIMYLYVWIVCSHY